MTGAELRAIRERFGMTQEEFGRALGYRGDNARKLVSRLECSSRPVPRLMGLALRRLPGTAVASLVEAYPEEFLQVLEMAVGSNLHDDAIAAAARLDGGRDIGTEEREDCKRRVAAFAAIRHAAKILRKVPASA